MKLSKSIKFLTFQYTTEVSSLRTVHDAYTDGLLYSEGSKAMV